MNESRITEAAALLLDHYLSGKVMAALPPGLAPEREEDAYAIQAAVAARSGGVGGYKISPARAGTAQRCAAIPAARIHRNGATVPLANIAPCNFEVELGFRLGADVVAGASTDAIEAAIADAFIAFELTASRIANPRQADPLSVLADAQVNAAIVVGDAVADWRSLDARTEAFALAIDGKPRGQVLANHGLAEVMSSFAWLADRAAQHFGGLRKDQVIITGARILDETPIVAPCEARGSMASRPATVSVSLR